MKERKEGGGDRITFIYSLYHDHSIKRSVSSRDDRSSRSQHPHVVGRSPFVVIVEVVSGSQRDSNLRGSGIPTISHVPRFTYISIFPVSSPFVHRFFHPSFLPSFLSFSVVLSPNKHVYRFSLNSNLDSMRFLLYVKLFRGKIAEGKNFFVSTYVKSYYFFL